jgi:hypothetical protein
MSFTLLAMISDTHFIQLMPFAIGNDLAVPSSIFTDGLVLAQQFQNVDLMANVQNGWTDFLKTGKAGALAIGLVLGYMIRGITR